MTKEQWHADLAYFARELPKRHLNAFHAVTREQFDAAVKELDASIDGANDDAIVVGFQRITAMIGDGHTVMHIPPNWHRLAVQIEPFGDEWRVTRVPEATKSILGGRVTAISGVPIAEVVRRLTAETPQDELPQLQRFAVTQKIHFAEGLHGSGITKSADEATLTVLGDDGATTDVVVRSVPFNTPTQDWVGISSETPISRRDPQSAFVVQYLPAQKTVCVNWRRYENLDNNAAKLWQLVDSSDVNKIVIDLRQNDGGDFKVGRRYMVSEVARRAAKVKPIVLISARTFSAAMVNAIDLRNDAPSCFRTPRGSTSSCPRGRRTSSSPTSASNRRGPTPRPDATPCWIGH